MLCGVLATKRDDWAEQLKLTGCLSVVLWVIWKVRLVCAVCARLKSVSSVRVIVLRGLLIVVAKEQGGGPPDTEAMRAARQQYPLSSGLYRLAGAHPRLAGRRPAASRRSRRGRASVGADYLGDVPWNDDEAAKTLVRAGEVAAVVPAAAGRPLAGPAAGEALCRPRLLSDPPTLKAALRAAGAGARLRRRRRHHAGRDRRRRRRGSQRFLADGAHGDMDWMETTAERRGDPRALWPEVRSVIMLGLNYGPDRRSAGDPGASATAARSRSMPRATTITS